MENCAGEWLSDMDWNLKTGCFPLPPRCRYSQVVCHSSQSDHGSPLFSVESEDELARLVA
jgi:hypothetical protein